MCDFDLSSMNEEMQKMLFPLQAPQKYDSSRNS